MPGSVHTLLEGYKFIMDAAVAPDSQSSEVNTGRIDMQDYDRVAIILALGAIASGGTNAVDVEQHDAASAGTTKDITGKVIDLAADIGGDDMHFIEVDRKELDHNGGFRWLSVEWTPAVAATEGAVIIVGQPRVRPQTNT